MGYTAEKATKKSVCNMDWDKLAGTIRTQNWIILLVLSGASYFAMNPPFTLGVILGGLMMIANFNVLQYTVRKAFSAQLPQGKRKGFILAKYYLRLFFLAAILYVLITRGLVHPVGLAVGLSTVVISIVNLAVRNSWKMSSGEVM
jgi:small-conductance mechanosensitive channel